MGLEKGLVDSFSATGAQRLEEMKGVCLFLSCKLLHADSHQNNPLIDAQWHQLSGGTGGQMSLVLHQKSKKQCVI